MRDLKHPVLKIGVVVLALAALAWYLLTPTLPQPEEKNRVYHPLGFSIIAPPEWNSTIGRNSSAYAGFISLSPAKAMGMYPELLAARFADEAQARATIEKEAMMPQQFQGQPAFVTSARAKYAWRWRAVVERNGQWYYLALQLPRTRGMDDRWMPYLVSLQINPAATTSQPTTLALPLTLPATLPIGTPPTAPATQPR